jgi:hypothetical protein
LRQLRPFGVAAGAAPKSYSVAPVLALVTRRYPEVKALAARRGLGETVVIAR